MPLHFQGIGALASPGATLSEELLWAGPVLSCWADVRWGSSSTFVEGETTFQTMHIQALPSSVHDHLADGNVIFCARSAPRGGSRPAGITSDSSAVRECDGPAGSGAAAGPGAGVFGTLLAV